MYFNNIRAKLRTTFQALQSMKPVVISLVLLHQHNNTKIGQKSTCICVPFLVESRSLIKLEENLRNIRLHVCRFLWIWITPKGLTVLNNLTMINAWKATENLSIALLTLEDTKVGEKSRPQLKQRILAKHRLVRCDIVI